MPKTKAQKLDIVAKGIKTAGEAKVIVFADFGGTSTEDLKSLRVILKDVNAQFQVIKKRLLKIILKEKSIDFDAKQFEGPVGTVFSRGDISEIAQSLHKFSKGKEKFKLLGGLDLITKEAISGDTVKAIGQLPSREILLGQLMGALTGPLRALMYVLQEKGKRSQAN